jgi:hypothetical protein
MIEVVRYTQRNVKRWRDGDMRKRWTAAGMLVAEQQFRRITGYRDLANFVIAIERHAARTVSGPARRSRTLRCQKSLLSDCQSPGGRRQGQRPERLVSWTGISESLVLRSLGGSAAAVSRLQVRVPVAPRRSVRTLSCSRTHSCSFAELARCAETIQPPGPRAERRGQR